jgi:hypothetical protein
VRDRTLSRRTFRRSRGWIRSDGRLRLGHGRESGCAATAGACRELLAVEPALWTFASVEGVEPTNNAAERALRHAVCWRKTSYGTDSSGGSRFVERVLTVVASCRQQGRGVLAFLTDAIQALRAGTTPPSLIPISTSWTVTLRRMKGRLGAQAALTATAHKLARIVYQALRRGMTYVRRGQEEYEAQMKEKQVKALRRKARQLGLEVVEKTSGSAPTVVAAPVHG